MQFRNPAGVHAPVASYSHQAEVSAGARWLVLSGQIGMLPDGALPSDPGDQFEVALDNIRRNLEAAGMGIGDVVKLTVYIAGELDAARRRAMLSAFFGEHRPCMTVLFVVALASPAIRVEIDAWAARETGGE